MKIWDCKIGEAEGVAGNADGPMREAVTRAYREITGQDPDFLFSGWGGELTEPERAVAEGRLPEGCEAQAMDPGAKRDLAARLLRSANEDEGYEVQ